MSSRFIAFNWKMNATKEEALDLFNFMTSVKRSENDVLVMPPFVYLEMASRILPPSIFIGAQDVSSEGVGAYTGEVSALMLKSLGVKYALVGHSERRARFSEGKEILCKKIQRLTSSGIVPIYCVGESLVLRENKQYLNFLKNQILEVLPFLRGSRFVLAYEPIWSIGSSKVASVKEIKELVSFFREFFLKEGIDDASILYGGSVNSVSVGDILNFSGVDGVLVGGASLKKEELSHLMLV